MSCYSGSFLGLPCILHAQAGRLQYVSGLSGIAHLVSRSQLLSFLPNRVKTILIAVEGLKIDHCAAEG